MEQPIVIAGLEDRSALIKMDFWAGPHLWVNGAPVQRPNKRLLRYLLQTNTGKAIEVVLKPRFLDPFPVIEVEGKRIELAPALTWYQWGWAGLPLTLAFVGGALGGVIGFLGAFTNIRVVRTLKSPTKCVLIGLISGAAFLIWVIAVSILFMIFPSLAKK